MMRFSQLVRAGLVAGLALVAPLATPDAASAQGRTNTILVLDGSGSMWGQIDGVNKITIAQDVVGKLLDTFPADQNLGLTVYGHREKGNCADIETVVAPGPGTLDAIRSAVNGIKPKGKTPMTDAVIAAANALRYTEEKATVILVSDGIETCNPDPCAAAAALDAAGVDFTAHVIGFDVTDPKALAQMQCLAEGTGGTFRKASDAAELSQALTEVAVEPEPEPEPEPVPVSITFQARLDTETGALIDGPVFWTLSPLPENVRAEEQGNNLSFDMLPGSYEVTAYWAEQEVQQTRQFIVADGSRTLVLVFDAPELTATVTAPATAVAGSTIEIAWDGPNIDGDFVGIGRVGAEGGNRWLNYVEVDNGSPAELLVPPTPGDYVIAYYLRDGYKNIGFAPITVTEVQATITAPATAPAGSTIELAWTGPDYRDDYIGIGRVGAEGAQMWENYVYTREGSPTKLVIPETPGDYLITYFIAQDRTSVVSVPITATEVGATITAPESAPAGSTIEISWTGPDYKDDYIGIGRADGEGPALWENYVYTREGSPSKLVVPETPGDYVITYFLAQGREPLVSIPFTATGVEASITAPESAPAGSSIEISWSGPNYKDDYIGIGRVGAEGGDQWENYVYTREGSPSKLVIPETPGDYVITYFMAQGRKPLVTIPFTATEVGATITAPDTAIAGDTIEITWTGPNYKDDYIGIGRVGSERSEQWESYVYTREGSPSKLRIPSQPGDYEISYFMAQGRKKLVTIPISVTEVTASITAPASAVAGDTIEITWSGPNYKDDYIGVGRVGAERSEKWENYAYTREGSPSKLLVPETPGDYVITYFMNLDRRELAQVPLTVTAVTATLDAPASAAAGSTIEVQWTGPDYRDDYIGIGRADAERGDRWEAYAYTRDGSPAKIDLPDTPGQYIIRYFMNQDYTVIAERPLTIQ